MFLWLSNKTAELTELPTLHGSLLICLGLGPGASLLALTIAFFRLGRVAVDVRFRQASHGCHASWEA